MVTHQHQPYICHISVISHFIHFHPFHHSIHFHLLSSVFIHFHPFSSTFPHFIHFHPLLSIFIHCHPFSSTFIHFHPKFATLPWSVSDHHRLVLNAQTYKWIGWDWKSLNASLLGALFCGANHFNESSRIFQPIQKARVGKTPQYGDLRSELITSF